MLETAIKSGMIVSVNMKHAIYRSLTDNDPAGNLIEHGEALALLKTGRSWPDKEKTGNNDQQLYNHDGTLRIANTVALLELP